MKKIILIIIIIFLLILAGVGYYVYLNDNQVVISENVFENNKNFFPFGTSSSEKVIPDQVVPPSENNKGVTTQTISLQNQGIRIVTNGITNPGIDPLYKNKTAYQQDGKSLDATTDNYVTVPKNTIPIGSRVYILNQKTGLDIWGVVGDIGPYGGISLYAVEQLGMWQQGMGLNLLPHSLIFKYYLK
jgi:flagellar basal body-associated protein FliL